MKYLILLILTLAACDVTEPLEEIACGADSINDLIGTWYETSTRPGIQPGYTTTDSTLWILERAPIYENETSMDSLVITREYHPGDETFDPTKHSQLQTTLPYNNSETSYGVLAYGNAEFRIPVCDSLTVNWTDATVHRLKRRH